MALKLRRGTEAERVTAFVDIGEIVYVTDTKKLFVGDGATTGGILVGPTALSTETSPLLGGNLNLNGNNIIGTGNINITGNITATGSINLGDNATDNISVLGLINSSLTPAIDDSYNLGTSAKQWRNLWATQANVDTTLAVGSQIIKLSSGSADSNLVLWDAETDTLTAREIIGDLTGSVFADDSSTLVDSVAGKIVGEVDNIAITTKDVNGATITLSGQNNNGTLAGLAIYTTGTADDAYDAMSIYGASNTVEGPAVLYSRYRGTHETPLPLQIGDKIVSQYWLGADSNGSPAVVAGIQIFVDDTPGEGYIPGRIELGCVNATEELVTMLSIDSEGIIGIQDNSIVAGAGSGEVNTGGTVKYIRIIVDGVDYALPLYPLNP